jgi:hypothetical protein
VSEFEDGAKKMVDYIRAMEREILKRKQVLSQILQGSIDQSENQIPPPKNYIHPSPILCKIRPDAPLCFFVVATF